MDGEEEIQNWVVESFSSCTAGQHPTKLHYSPDQDNPLPTTLAPNSTASNAQNASRWSTSTLLPQWIIIKTASPIILRKLYIGKYNRTSLLCNLKDFKVIAALHYPFSDSIHDITSYAYYSSNNTGNTTNTIPINVPPTQFNTPHLLISSALRNDPDAELFDVKQPVNDAPEMPIQYIKLIPLSFYKGNSFTIKNIKLFGVSDKSYVDRKIQEYNAYLEGQAMRLCLRYFREKGWSDVFDNLSKKSETFPLEHPFISSFYRAAEASDFAALDRLLQEANSRNLFNDFISEGKALPIWRRIFPNLAPNDEQANALPPPAPTPRGGHQMCIDPEDDKIYLFAGWSGSKDLNDFWVFNMITESWSLISANTTVEGGPTPRSCHKICYDPDAKIIYFLGRYLDTDDAAFTTKGDFYSYHIPSKKWTKISEDTKAEGGPDLIYDHQMSLDSEEKKIYIFGGKVITTASENIYAGLYSYHIPTNKWAFLREDKGANGRSVDIQSRIGHSMLLTTTNHSNSNLLNSGATDPNDKILYIFAGQRVNMFLSDFYSYHIASGKLKEISRDSAKEGGPGSGFTQRATIDDQLGEIYVLSGLMRERYSPSDSIKNCLWMYRIKTGKWRLIYSNENTDPKYWHLASKQQPNHPQQLQQLHQQNATEAWSKEPCPRFAAQFVYSPKTRRHYLFGGNPGEYSEMSVSNAILPAVRRLGDLWVLDIIRTTNEEIMQHCKYLLKKQFFIELCYQGKGKEAIEFMKTEISPLVNSTNVNSELYSTVQKDFKALSALLLFPPKNEEELNMQRRVMVTNIVQYLPPSMKSPSVPLTALIPSSQWLS